MTGNEIRETFLQYFEQRGHTRVRSSPLLPANDPTLLFTNAGMNQFKDVFLGLEKREYVRACSSQKCVRAGGKHNDLDEVGKTARHQTFFEMLGNFSFGDYFKREAIEYAWDFLTGSRDEGKLGLDPERLWFTVFGGDDEVPADEEAEALWVEVGARPERVLRFGRKDNFWQMAETGPCGPNSEINYYIGEHPEDPEFNRADLVNGPGDTTMEIWNLVFMQYNRVEEEPGKYKLEPLPKPSVDTGMGLERTAAILQGKFSTYETDLIRPIIDFTARLAGRDYETETQEGFAMRVIADHARSTAFLIADGILPGNEGRNYVLRKIMRRAIYQGLHTLGFQDSFFHKVTNFVVDQMHEPYPELEASRDFIERMVKLEEERFGNTLSVGLEKLRSPAVQMQLDPMLETLATFHEVIPKAQRNIAEALKKSLPSPDVMAQVNQSLTEVLRRSLPSPDVMAQVNQSVAEALKRSLPSPDVMAQVNQSLAEVLRRSLPSPDLMAQVNQSVAEALKRSLPSPDVVAQVNQSLAEVLRRSLPSPDLMAQVNQSVAEALRKSLPSPRVMEQINQSIAEALRTSLPPPEQLAEMHRRILEAFRSYARLYDTFGTPRDLIRVSLEEHGANIQEEKFNDEFDAALKDIQRAGQRETTEAQSKAKPIYAAVLERAGNNVFTGYEGTQLEDSRILALIRGDQKTVELNEGDEGEVILDRTPFYAEAGGQVGDIGTLAAGSAHVTVNNTQSTLSGLIVHRVKVDHGTLKVGDVVVAQVDVEKRDATRRNHTATHLLHAALREVLGGQVKQAGSVVAPNYLRFDFTHFQALSEQETVEIERLVNNQILRNVEVSTDIMPVEDAIRSGAMALFGEKYAGMMRVLTIPGFSKELCGGTHVRATGDIGLFKITSDESIASGVRRIRAVTGVDAFERFREAEAIVERVASGLRTSRAELPVQVERLQEELKKARREADDLRMKLATGAAGSSANGDESREVAGVRVVAREASGLDAAGMRQLSDTLLARIKSGVVVLGRSGDGKASLIVRSSPDISTRVPAGQVIKELAPIVGGRGGGKPDMAEGGGNQPEKLAEALEASYKVVERLLG